MPNSEELEKAKAEFQYRLKNARVNRGISQTELYDLIRPDATEAKNKASYIGSYENGKRFPKQCTLYRIIDVLHITGAEEDSLKKLHAKIKGYDILSHLDPDELEQQKALEAQLPTDTEMAHEKIMTQAYAALNKCESALNNDGLQNVVNYMNDICEVPKYRKEER